MALPSFDPEFDEDFRNLAGFQEAAAVMAPPLAPLAPRTLYRAWDGEPIGYSSDCDPLTAEPQLSGLLVPAFLEDSRMTWGEQWAMPLIAGAIGYQRDGTPLAAALWALAGFLLPLPTAGVVVAREVYGADLLPSWLR